MVRYVCDNCRYSFEPKGGHIPKTCPYCNRGPIAQQKSAQDLIDDIL